MTNRFDAPFGDLLTFTPFGFQSSSMVERAAVNRDVVGSSPTSGAILGTLDFLKGFSRREAV